MLRRSLILAVAALTLAACSRGDEAAGDGPLRVGATAVPHAEILEFIKPTLAAEGVEIEVQVFNDYVQPNVQVDERRLDANYFQTAPYLEEFIKSRGADLVNVANIHIEPLGAYSRRHANIAAVPNGADVAIPNEASNSGRALLLLQKAGLITLADPNNPLATLNDITSNPRNLRIREIEAATLPRVLDQVDLAVINTNYALDAGLNPSRDALAMEDGASPYVNMLVARSDNRDDPRIQALARALRSQAVRDFIAREYEGAVIPAT